MLALAYGVQEDLRFTLTHIAARFQSHSIASEAGCNSFLHFHPMFICVNSRGLSPIQRDRIEKYFKDNFSFEGKRLKPVWQQDDSEFILLGYPYGSSAAPVGRQPGEEFGSIMYRVHENELFEIAGRNIWHLVNDWSHCQSA